MTPHRRKIAVLVPFPIAPPDDGGRVRPYNIIKQLATRFDLVLLTPPMHGARLDLPVTVYECIGEGQRNQLFSPAFLLRAQRILRRERPDVLFSEFIWHGIHCALLAPMLRVPFVVDSPNVESARFRSTGRPWRLVRAWERIATHFARRVYVVSDEDRDVLARQGLPTKKIEVVPNGVDPGALYPDAAAGSRLRAELGTTSSTRLLLFFGQLDYAPNREALTILDREILPRLRRAGSDFQLLVIGKGDPEPFRSGHRPNVRIVGPVDRVAPYINAADTVVVPIVSGGGSRLKILESIACGTRVVSTTSGAEGIDRAICGGLLDVTDDWESFAERAMETPAESSSPPSAFLDRYAWHNIVARLQL